MSKYNKQYNKLIKKKIQERDLGIAEYAEIVDNKISPIDNFWIWFILAHCLLVMYIISDKDYFVKLLLKYDNFLNSLKR